MSFPSSWEETVQRHHVVAQTSPVILLVIDLPGKLHFVGVIILRLLAEKEKQVSPNNLTGFLFRSAFPCFYQTVILRV